MQPTLTLADSWQEQLRQRMALAKKQGWGDQDIQRSAAVETALHQQQLQQQQQQATQQQTSQAQNKTSGRGGFLSSIISELGGAGGAAGGAAIGTAIAPGIGTIIGAGLGGLFGGAGGSAVEQKVRNGNVNWGNAAKEGGLDAIFSGAGEGLSAAKGAYTAAKAAKSGLPATAADLFAENAPKAVGRTPGVIQRTGEGLTAGGLGLAQGAGSGANKIGAAESQNLVQTLKTLGVPLRSPESTQAALEGKLGQLGGALQTAYQRASTVVPVAQNEVQNLAMGILQKVGSMGGLDKSAENYAMDQAQRLVQNGGDLNSLWGFTKDLENNTINFARSDSAAEPMKEAVAQIVKGDVRSFLNAKVPGLTDLNSAYSSATTANRLLIDASRNSRGGLVPRLLSSTPVRTVETKAGQLIENVGKATAGTGTGVVSAPFTAATHQLTRQALPDIGNMMGNSAQGQTQQDNIQQLQAQDTGQQMPFANPQNSDQQVLNMAAQSGAQNFNDFASALSMGDQSGLSGAGATDGQAGTGPSSDQYVQAALKALQAGDMKSYNALIGVAGDLQSYQAKQLSMQSSGNNTISSTAQAQANKATSALQSLGDLQGMIANNPSLTTKSAVPGQGLPVVGSLEQNALGTAQYTAALNNVRLQVGFLLSGANVPTDEKAAITQLMPSAGDSAQTMQYKVNSLAQMLQAYAQQGAGNTSTSDSTDQLAGLLPSGAY